MLTDLVSILSIYIHVPTITETKISAPSVVSVCSVSKAPVPHLRHQLSVSKDASQSTTSVPSELAITVDIKQTFSALLDKMLTVKPSSS